ncbi:MAG: hypothetical protein WC867_01700 [Candidatus Pacearchaeota archaeon]|jgi:uncharacterized membrane-anchored protein YitT (DUF2179 family)
MKNKKAQVQPEFITKKKSNWWIWVLIILILLGVGIGIYFWLASGSGGTVIGGNSIPQPPQLPE